MNIQKSPIVVFHTDHFMNTTVTQFLAKSNGLRYAPNNHYENFENIICASYGILRGNTKLYSKFKKFIYIDHGYMGSSLRSFNKNKSTTIQDLNGYFRFVKNDFYFNKDLIDNNKERFQKLKIDLKPLNKNAEYILLSEPSDHTLKFLNIPNWTENTINEIKKFSDRKILIHNKFSKIPLGEVLNQAFAFVSCQSTASFKSIASGVPAYFTHDTMKSYGHISNIEDRNLNYDLLYSAANSQWMLKELFSDDFKNFLNKLIN